ncbi:MAG TPA: NUDIX domain-containing protein [Candidatus Saccharimonadia bacterium]|nr:NUDIX domain-containing protein [Candidatus Saccharimonadia bacterium]
MPVPILKVAAKAVILDPAGQVLILREGPAGDGNTNVGRYQLPGGKLEPGEAFADGLAREIKEETGLTVEVIRPLHVGEWRPHVHGQTLQIVGIFMLCRTEVTDITLSDEHDDHQWIDPAQRHHYDLMPPEDAVIDQLISE